MWKKNNVMPTFIFLVVIATLVSAAVFFNDYSRKDNTSSVEALYDKIVSYDLENNYPKTPQEVMDLYCDCLYYLYGGKANETKLMDIVLVQRKLYADALLNINASPDVQYTSTMLTINSLRQKKLNFISVTHEFPVYNENDQELCSVEVTQYSNAKSDMNSSDNADLITSYNLIKDSNGRWKISGWENINNDTDGLNPEE